MIVHVFRVKRTEFDAEGTALTAESSAALKSGSSLTFKSCSNLLNVAVEGRWHHLRLQPSHVHPLDLAGATGGPVAQELKIESLFDAESDETRMVLETI